MKTDHCSAIEGLVRVLIAQWETADRERREASRELERASRAYGDAERRLVEKDSVLVEVGRARDLASDLAAVLGSDAYRGVDRG